MPGQVWGRQPATLLGFGKVVHDVEGQFAPTHKRMLAAMQPGFLTQKRAEIPPAGS